ncbi:hypothetical protein LX32DRAFT_682930 [Colletotrichum zoysiae]|uniref:Amine oxidase domain-containing protein n=1 Tax=Colletotrichum zoysiae TaxID=1216348 RepID=A0AAD9HIM9_9PEZI|nr:hypothetical protein LX32DRAFT_682930 [Colletotrichum zoysiae]
MSPHEDGPQAASATAPPENVDPYKYQWARYVARHKLDKDISNATNKVQSLIDNPNAPRFMDEAPKTVTGLFDKLTKHGQAVSVIPPQHGHFKVGIVGAGAAGLFTGLVLDWINETIQKHAGPGKLKIDYEILEAAGEDRFGGRLYTHRFSKDGTHDYYDVGAMRFPDNDVMDSPTDWPVLIPYYLRDDKDVCPSYFNNVKKVGRVWEKGEVDPYNLNRGIAEDQQIPPELLAQDPSQVFQHAIREILELTKESFDVGGKNRPRSKEENTKLWELLMKMDHMSVRQFLLSGTNPDGIPKGPSYSNNTIQWLETATYGTGWYDQSLTEAVLETLDFEVPATVAAKTNDYWWCVDGGAQKIAETMRKRLKDQSVIKYNTQVVGIDAKVELNKRVRQEMQLNIKDTATGEPLEPKRYFTVFNSATLGATSRMDLSNAGLLWDTKQAIRCLNYGASTKVGIKFKTAWWRRSPFNIDKGGLARTDLPLQVCVYPSYNIDKDLDPIDKPAVLLVSYTWGQTAQRLATLMASKGQKTNEEILKEEAELKDVLLRDLAYLHADDPNIKKSFKETLDMVHSEYLEHHAYDWYHDPHMAGAFAYFGPCQFSKLYPAITKPNAYGQLFFVGEAASAHHAWVVGALESVIRALYLMFNTLHQSSIQDEGEGYRPYSWAMQLLESGCVEDEDVHIPLSTDPLGLPFYPLPAEMPVGRKRDVKGPQAPKDDGSGPGHDLLDHLQKEAQDNQLTWGAAYVALALVEFALDNWFIPEADKGEVKPQ